jgi:pimeloyl-ACP methyl ester carboxylesterase
VLVHGFGASAYHWRYNIPVLAASHRVYAVDLLGFGWSDKPLIPGYADYSVWQDQLAAFIREVCATTFVASANPGRSATG